MWAKIKSSLNVDNITQHLHDVKTTWIILLVAAVIAFLIGLMTIFMMKCCAPLLVWGIILCYLMIVIAFGFLFYSKYNGSYEIDSLDFINNQLSDNESALLGFIFIYLTLRFKLI